MVVHNDVNNALRILTIITERDNNMTKKKKCAQNKYWDVI